jgi:FAD/FMN-containing dehydrogenase
VGRRRFLAAAGLAAAGISGCSSTQPPLGCGSDDPARPPHWATVRSHLSQRLLLPGDAGYAEASRPYNRLFDGRRPAAVARCARVEDVQLCLEAGRSAGLPMAARSGGHSYAGYSTPDGGLVIALRDIADVRVHQDGVAEIGAGARLIDVYAALARAGRCLPAGTCASLGIAGLTLGGGIGVLSRKFGLTCDRLIAARMVAPDGRVVLASREAAPELFWALRGGGGGNFGIVTTLWLRTEPLPELTVFELHFPDGSAPEVLGAWQEWMSTAPDELWARLIVTGGGPPACKVQGCFVGSATAVDGQLAGLVRSAGTQPSSQAAWGAGFLNTMRYFADCSDRSIQECRDAETDGQAFAASSRVQQHQVDPPQVIDLLRGREKLTLLFEPLGGAIARTPVRATAFPHRHALATVQVFAPIDRSHPEIAAEVAAVQQALAAVIGAGAYINYADPGQRDWAQASYGPNLPLVRAIARRWDPQGVLAFPQGLTEVC